KTPARTVPRAAQPGFHGFVQLQDFGSGRMLEAGRVACRCTNTRREYTGVNLDVSNHEERCAQAVHGVCRPALCLLRPRPACCARFDPRTLRVSLPDRARARDTA